MKIFTIGFTKKSAEVFFSLLKDAGVRRLLDIRLNNVSQLAAFAKRDDLEYFAHVICGIDYLHMPRLAPTSQILDPYKKVKNGDWSLYQEQFLSLMRERKVEDTPKELLDGSCLLCSEDTPEHCHRRLVAEYLRNHWGDVEILHL